jgi:hypothetical protein
VLRPPPVWQMWWEGNQRVEDAAACQDRKWLGAVQGPRGRVATAGRTLTWRKRRFSPKLAREKLTALLTATLMTVDGRDGVGD